MQAQQQRLSRAASSFVASHPRLRGGAGVSRRAARAPGGVEVRAYRESEKIQDWRVQQASKAVGSNLRGAIGSGLLPAGARGAHLGAQLPEPVAAPGHCFVVDP
jgi:hypothetical protein